MTYRKGNGPRLERRTRNLAKLHHPLQAMYAKEKGTSLEIRKSLHQLQAFLYHFKQGILANHSLLLYPILLPQE